MNFIKKISLTAILFNLAIALFTVGVASTAGYDLPSWSVPAVFSVLSMPQSTAIVGMAFNTVRVELWTPDIREKLFPDNSFISRRTNDDAFIQGTKVIRPIAGDNPDVEKNVQQLPMTIGKRDDLVSEYDLDEYITQPMVIRDLDEVETNYNVQQSIITSHTNSLNTQVAAQLATAWATLTASRIQETTGANTPTKAQGATGNRKGVTLDNVLKLHDILDDDDVPYEGRVLVIPAWMYRSLYREMLTGTDKVSLTMAEVQEATGFEIFKRSKVAQYNAGGTVKRLVSKQSTFLSTAVTDQGVAIAYHPNWVAAGVGSIEPLVDAFKRPEYAHGYVANVKARMGGRIISTTDIGVAALKESAA